MGASLQSKSRVGRAGARSRAYRPMSDINVTPFVDVMLVLLVVFMIAAPLLTSGVTINLPRSDAKPITEENNKPLEINLTIKGEIFIGDTEVERTHLINLLEAMTDENADQRIFIRADTSLDYGRVMDILGALNKAGFKKVALLSEPSR